MSEAPAPGRPNQRRRTRKDLLQAASRLLQQGRRPTLEDVASEALASRATADRSVPRVEALLAEAALDVAVPEADALFRNGGSSPADPVARLERVDDALHAMMVANESQLRKMLMYSLQRGTNGEPDADLPARQNRRTPLIEAALEPVRKQFKPAALETLTRAIALIVGTEAMIVFKDVLQVDDAEARKVKRWAIRALVAAARSPARPIDKRRAGS